MASDIFPLLVAAVNPPRPLVLSILCIAGFLVCFLGIFMVYSPAIQQTGKLYAFCRSLGFTLQIVSFSGLWLMRRWALWIFIGFFIFNQVICLAFGTWDKTTLMPLLVLGVILAYYRRMN